MRFGFVSTALCGAAAAVTSLMALASPTVMTVAGMVLSGLGLLLSASVFMFSLGYEYRKSEEDDE